MANTTPGTFIPRDTVTQARPRGRTGLNELLLLFAIVLVVASAALAVGVFLYGQFLQTQAASKITELQRAEAAFEPTLIQQLTKLDDRMHSADAILAVHTAPTVFFQALGASTLQTVSFSSLSYDASDVQHITLQLQGVAQSVNSIAYQDNLFSKSGVITNPIFSNIARQENGVHFSLAASVNPSAINFVSLIAAAANGARGQSGVSTPAPSQPASDTTASPFGSGAEGSGASPQ